jgi:hypothetical protein
MKLVATGGIDARNGVEYLRGGEADRLERRRR